MKPTVILISILWAVTSSAGGGEVSARVAHANLGGGGVSGSVELAEESGGTLVSLEVRGLAPGSIHGVHVHQFGKCDAPDFKTAGDHFNPNGSGHGSPGHRNHHVGDLGNITANGQGVAKKEVLMPSLRLAGRSSAVGKAIIVHAKADDLTTQPSGNSGDRIACGIINPSL